ncbi:Protein of unknown function [Bacillus mycoides]|nr:Protein of unknown function [Bacillus mycoides]
MEKEEELNAAVY